MLKRAIRITVNCNCRNCNYLALMGNTGVVWLGTANMKTKFAEYDTKQTHVPKEFAWCGTSAVVMYDNRTRNLSLIDLSGQCLRYDVANDVILISEMDALRIFRFLLFILQQRWSGGETSAIIAS